MTESDYEKLRRLKQEESDYNRINYISPHHSVNHEACANWKELDRERQIRKLERKIREIDQNKY